MAQLRGKSNGDEEDWTSAGFAPGRNSAGVAPGAVTLPDHRHPEASDQARQNEARIRPLVHTCLSKRHLTMQVIGC